MDGSVICRETMMHSHDRCIKVVYAREEEEEDQPLSLPLPLPLKPRRIMKVVKRLNR